MRHLPNLICLLRIVLIWPIAVALQSGDHLVALVLFVAASVSDGLDGYLAKRFAWTSELGKFLDPLADKLLLVTVFLVATWQGLVPLWLTAAAVARDVLIGFGALVFRTFFGPLRGRPTGISKVNTAVQLTFLILTMLRAASGFPPAEPMAALAVLTLATTLISGADYTIAMVRRALVASPGNA